MSNFKNNVKSSYICSCLQKKKKKNLFNNKKKIFFNDYKIIYYTHNTETIIRHLNRSIKNKQNNILIGSKSSSLPEKGWIHSCYFCHSATYNYYMLTEYSNIFICNNCKKHKNKIIKNYLDEILEYIIE